MEHPFGVESPFRGQLTDLVSRVVDVEVRLRAIQAERAALLAEAYDLAEREGTRAVSTAAETLSADSAAGAGSRPSSTVRFEPVTTASNDGATTAATGSGASAASAASAAFGPAGKLPHGMNARRDRAHRLIRAELAAALHLSEWSIGNDISHAVDSLTHCPTIHHAQTRGQVSEKHLRTIVDAGRIIGIRATEHLGTTLTAPDGTPLNPADAEEEISRRYATFERAILPHAASLTPAQLAPVAKRLAEKLAGVTFDDRHRVANRARTVTLTELDDGMCNVTALVTSFEGHAIFDRLTQYAKQLQASDLAAISPPTGSETSDAVGTRTGTSNGAGPGVSSGAWVAAEVAATALKRPLAEARADSLVSLLLEGVIEPPADGPRKKIGPGVTARVQVLVPVSLTGRLTPSDTGTGSTRRAGDSAQTVDGWFQPELVGVGPIDTDTTARIMHDTPTWDMIVVTDGTTEPCPSATAHSTGPLAGIGSGIDTTGDILTVDGYRVPARLRRHLAARDQHCRFIGCTLPVYRCDIDHTIAAEEGGPHRGRQPRKPLSRTPRHETPRWTLPPTE